jgi:hypothetical protein
MGTDIHFYVEVFNNGDWVTADKWEEDKDEEQPVKYVNNQFYHDRNYDLFAILADVRNGRGFAGVKTSDGFNPISHPRGLPNDACKEILELSKHWGIDGHSHSWLTVKELMAFDWTQTVKKCGLVSGEIYYSWNQYNRENGEAPEEYCGGVGGHGVIIVSEEEMSQLINEMKNKLIEAGVTYYRRELLEKIKSELNSTYCSVEWEQPYYKAARFFLSDCLPRLWRLGEPDKVRIVFWFDN